MKSIDAKRWNHLLGLERGTHCEGVIARERASGGPLKDGSFVFVMFAEDGSVLAVNVGTDEFWERQP